MQCGIARSWLQSRRDTALSASQQRELDQHVVNCGECAALSRDVRLVESWLEQAPVEDPAANFEWRLKLRLAQVERDSRDLALPARRTIWRPWLQFGGAAAIAALVVVGVGMQVLRSGPAVAPSGGMAFRSAAHGGIVQPLRDAGPGSPSFVGPPVPAAYSYFISSTDSSSSALDSARTPNTFEAR